MAYKILYIYDTTVNPDNVPDKLIEDIPSNDFMIGVTNCVELKKSSPFMPVGFTILEYDEDDLNIIEEKTYFINGKIIDKSNQPSSWKKEKLFDDCVKAIVCINDNYCAPFNPKTDKILTIPNF